MVKRKAAFLATPSMTLRPRRRRTENVVSGSSTAVLPKTVSLEDGFLSESEADKLREFLKKNVDFQQGQIKMFGKLINEPRLNAWLGCSYKYAGRLLKARPLCSVPELDSIGKRLSSKLGVPFNSVLMNMYRNGDDYMGYHADDERELGPGKNDIVIASISLGATREFRMRSRVGAEDKYCVELKNGSLLVMRGNTQQLYKHSVPKSKKVTEERINLTFRCLTETRM
eukprot:CAMPEP_0198735102 /NCGR_PEP_ID=MMETSP1475-20131203/57305_1 /TAXON_ID= ORGANISM="Unidentified sp., Strain CCMP1999" /NCGR_SAMPLE_ID=MMETSP1475 /ASSEMBLY_ACC=CAM_ASM_001111 /LENGTH=226 /DNA_ID=CAMNT_0044498705 /DNA_START=132 /DNA_END=812 /DNA_ORIENTATION=+